LKLGWRGQEHTRGKVGVWGGGGGGGGGRARDGYRQTDREEGNTGFTSNATLLQVF
jgi:hypothetical protein